MEHQGTVPLDTKRLILRQFTLDDAEAMFRNWASDPEVTTYLTWPAHTDASVSQAVINSWLPLYTKSDHYSWAIVLKDLGEPIGSIAAVERRDDIRMVHIGYCIGRTWWRQGYTSEALAELIRFFFEEVGVNRIESRHDPRNPGSGKVMQKCDLKYEGTTRQDDINNQGICDSARYAMLAGEYFERKRTESPVTIGDISIDCKNPEATRDFYANLTGWKPKIIYGCPAVIAENGLVLLFMACDFEYIPPVWPEESGRQQKQIHLDFTVDDLPAAVDKAIRFGAIEASEQYGGEHCTTMLDPEGHPFCLIKRQRKSEFETYFQNKGYDAIPNPSINIDCKKYAPLRKFYEQLTDWDRDFHPAALIADNGLVVHFMECDGDFDYIPPVWPEESVKQQKQMHINFQVDDVQAAAEKAVRLGAAKPNSQYGGEHFVTLLDPEGHPFCLCRK